MLGLLVIATAVSQAIGQLLWASARVAVAALAGARRRRQVAAGALRLVLGVSVAGVALAPTSAAAQSNDVAYRVCERAASKIHGRAARELARRACTRITVPTTATTTVVAAPTQQEPLKQLDDLHIGEEVLAGYVRDDWPHWSDADGDGCNTRKELLKARSTTPALIEAGSVCTIVAGTWVDPYSGRTLTSPAQVEIDHLVPLANAYRSGGHAWSVIQREAFDEAKKWFARCLEWEPNNIEAQRGLRLVQSRNDQKGSQKSSGLLSRFLSKKN